MLISKQLVAVGLLVAAGDTVSSIVDAGAEVALVLALSPHARRVLAAFRFRSAVMFPVYNTGNQRHLHEVHICHPPMTLDERLNCSWI